MAGSVAFLSLATSALRVKRPEAKKAVASSPPQRNEGLTRVISYREHKTPVGTSDNFVLAPAYSSSRSSSFSSTSSESSAIDMPRPKEWSEDPFMPESSSLVESAPKSSNEGSGANTPPAPRRKVYYFDNPRFLPQ